MTVAAPAGRNGYIPALDGLRFIAFLLVFLHHSLYTGSAHFTAFQQTMWFGVELFFVLSGFLITRLLIAEFSQTGGISLKRYAWRRILRIWPLYFFAIATFSLFVGYNQESDYLSHLLSLATFTQNLHAAFSGWPNFPLVSHLWTIAAEEQFYLFIPAFAFLAVRSRRQFLIVAGAWLFISLVFRIVMIREAVPYPAIWVFTLAKPEALLAGVALAIFERQALAWRFRWVAIAGLAIAGLFLLFGIGAIWEPGWHQAVIYYGSAGLALAMLWAVLGAPALSAILALRPLAYLGKISFGLYVFHRLPIVLAGDYLPQIHNAERTAGSWLIWAADFSIILGATVLLASLSYHFLERPFLKLKTRFETISSRPV